MTKIQAKNVVYSLLAVCLIALIFMFIIMEQKSKEEREWTHSRSVGVVRDVTIIPASFFVVTKTQVKCDSLSIVLQKTPTISLGRKAFVKRDQWGDYWFVVEGALYNYRMK